MVGTTESENVQKLGYISRPTLRELLLEVDDKLTDEELTAAIDEVDEDGSGKIEWEGEPQLSLTPLSLNLSRPMHWKRTDLDRGARKRL